MNLIDLFDSSLLRHKDDVALEFEGRTSTFGDLETRSNRIANFLRTQGFQLGDRLCIYLANSADFIHLYLACLKLGVIFVPINILYRDREITHILNDAAPRAAISNSPLPAATPPIPAWTLTEFNAAAADSSDLRPPRTADGDTPAALVYTSGTTGTSKGAILTHNNFAANALNLLACWQISRDDRFLLVLPLFHVHGLGNGLHCWLISGCRMRLLERFEHQRAAEEFLDFRPTLFFGVPTIYVRLLDMPPHIAQEIGTATRLFVSGSAPLPAQVLEEFRVRFGHTILERYGMTETLMNMSNPYVGERRAGSVGMPLPGISMRLLGHDGQPVAEGETGEIYLRGPNLFAGYWRRDDATLAAFVDGYFRTGDLATRSSDGYYTLSGRKSDLIISGGFNIYPREIEEFLEEQPEVAEAAVVAVADRVRGEVPVAYIVSSAASFNCNALAERCRAKLASFKVPREFISVEKLPRNALGKIQKHLLPKITA